MELISEDFFSFILVFTFKRFNFQAYFTPSTPKILFFIYNNCVKLKNVFLLIFLNFNENMI